ncbi:MAG: DMT family transporter [Nocardioides sp.]|nr:DMT family transporter [Nocardioides sp.]
MTVLPPPRPVAAWLPAAAAATTLLLWASAFVAIRHLGETVNPGALSLGRLVVAAAALGVLLALRPRRTSGSAAGRRPRWPIGRQWWLMLVCGTAWFGVYNLALNESERRIDAGTAAMLVQVGPLLVAVLAVLFLGEVFSRWVLAGVLVGLSGIVVIGTAMAEGSNGDLIGVLLGVLAAATYAIGVVTQKPLVRTLPAMEVTWLACVIGAVVCLPWAGDLVEVVRTADAATLWLLGYLGLFPTALAFTTWAFALHHFDASRLSILTFLVPVLTVVIAWATLGETPPVAAYLGGALCVVGVLLSRRRPAAVRPVVGSAAASEESASRPATDDGAGVAR